MKKNIKVCWLLVIAIILSACSSNNINSLVETEENLSAAEENSTSSPSSEEIVINSPIEVQTKNPVIIDNFIEIVFDGYNFETNQEYNEKHWDVMQYSPLPEDGAELCVIIDVKNIGDTSIPQDGFGIKRPNYTGPMPAFFVVDHNLISNPLNGRFYDNNGYLIEDNTGYSILPGGQATARLSMDIPASAESLLPDYYVMWEYDGVEYRWSLDGEIDIP